MTKLNDWAKFPYLEGFKNFLNLTNPAYVGHEVWITLLSTATHMPSTSTKEINSFLRENFTADFLACGQLQGTPAFLIQFLYSQLVSDWTAEFLLNSSRSLPPPVPDSRIPVAYASLFYSKNIELPSQDAVDLVIENLVTILEVTKIIVRQSSEIVSAAELIYLLDICRPYPVLSVDLPPHTPASSQSPVDSYDLEFRYRNDVFCLTISHSDLRTFLRNSPTSEIPETEEFPENFLGKFVVEKFIQWITEFFPDDVWVFVLKGFILRTFNLPLSVSLVSVQEILYHMLEILSKNQNHQFVYDVIPLAVFGDQSTLYKLTNQLVTFLNTTFSLLQSYPKLMQVHASIQELLIVLCAVVLPESHVNFHTNYKFPDLNRQSVPKALRHLSPTIHYFSSESESPPKSISSLNSTLSNDDKLNSMALYPPFNSLNLSDGFPFIYQYHETQGKSISEAKFYLPFKFAMLQILACSNQRMAEELLINLLTAVSSSTENAYAMDNQKREIFNRHWGSSLVLLLVLKTNDIKGFVSPQKLRCFADMPVPNNVKLSFTFGTNGRFFQEPNWSFTNIKGIRNIFDELLPKVQDMKFPTENENSHSQDKRHLVMDFEPLIASIFTSISKHSAPILFFYLAATNQAFKDRFLKILTTSQTKLPSYFTHFVTALVAPLLRQNPRQADTQTTPTGKSPQMAPPMLQLVFCSLLALSRSFTADSVLLSLQKLPIPIKLKLRFEEDEEPPFGELIVRIIHRYIAWNCTIFHDLYFQDLLSSLLFNICKLINPSWQLSEHLSQCISPLTKRITTTDNLSHLVADLVLLRSILSLFASNTSNFDHPQLFEAIIRVDARQALNEFELFLCRLITLLEKENLALGPGSTNEMTAHIKDGESTDISSLVYEVAYLVKYLSIAVENVVEGEEDPHSKENPLELYESWVYFGRAHIKSLSNKCSTSNLDFKAMQVSFL
eukprot:GHVP01032028.1.p1 GENE.GHVP01032028.1~~GHVP01032028.1.p1  ORF type:complete len:954 (+),score=154.08 GHVP01032028.1:643-3504(+)